MTANIPCPHCGSKSTYTASVPHAWLRQQDVVLVCNPCGHRVYGIDKIRELDTKRELEARAAREAEEARLREEAARAAEEAKRARILEEIMQNAKCAWPPCPNDHTMSSKYCSRTCNDKNAHARAKARREQQRLAMTGS